MTKVRTTINLILPNYQFAKSYIRNLSVWVDAQITKLRLEQDGSSISYECSCGAVLYEAALKKHQGKCPSCGSTISAYIGTVA